MQVERIPEVSAATGVDVGNLPSGSLIGVGASAGPIASDVIRASLESRPLQQELGLFVSGAQRKLVPDDQK